MLLNIDYFSRKAIFAFFAMSLLHSSADAGDDAIENFTAIIASKQLCGFTVNMQMVSISVNSLIGTIESVSPGGEHWSEVQRNSDRIEILTQTSEGRISFCNRVKSEMSSFFDATVKFDNSVKEVPIAKTIVRTDSNFYFHLMNQLSCTAKPNPTTSFLHLNSLKLIDIHKNRGADSVSCFDIDGGLDIEGLRFDFICGFSEDRLIWDLFPDLYRRAPGTSPGESISLGANTSPKKLKEWWQSRGVAGNPQFSSYTSHIDHMSEGISEIGCSPF